MSISFRNIQPSGFILTTAETLDDFDTENLPKPLPEIMASIGSYSKTPKSPLQTRLVPKEKRAPIQKIVDNYRSLQSVTPSASHYYSRLTEVAEQNETKQIVPLLLTAAIAASHINDSAGLRGSLLPITTILRDSANPEFAKAAIDRLARLAYRGIGKHFIKCFKPITKETRYHIMFDQLLEGQFNAQLKETPLELRTHVKDLQQYCDRLYEQDLLNKATLPLSPKKSPTSSLTSTWNDFSEITALPYFQLLESHLANFNPSKARELINMAINSVKLSHCGCAGLFVPLKALIETRCASESKENALLFLSNEVAHRFKENKDLLLAPPSIKNKKAITQFYYRVDSSSKNESLLGKRKAEEEISSSPKKKARLTGGLE